MNLIRILLLLLSTSLVKGYSYLATPFIYKKFGAETLGEYSLIITLSLFISQFIAFNATPVLLRASDNRGLMSFIATFFLSISTIIFSVIFLISIFFVNLLPDIFMLTLLLSASEALFIISAAFYRGTDRYFVFFIITFLKVLSAIYFINFYMSDVRSLVMFTSFISFILSTIVFLNVYFFSAGTNIFNKEARVSYRDETIKNVRFGLQLLPHTIGAWGLNSANRVLLAFISGSAALGIFSALTIYTFSIILVNSVLTLYLPREIVRSFSNFKNSGQDIKALYFYLLTTSIIIACTFLFVFYDKFNVVYIESYSFSDLVVVLVMILTYINLGVYQFLANYLFYYKRAKDISKNTLHTAIFSLFSTALLIYFFEVSGAALAFYITSWFYIYVTHSSLRSLNLESNSMLILKKYVIFTFSVAPISFLMFSAFWWFFC